ncbi:transposase [Nocardiopsis sp. EMB25]|uniref:RNA-guided endonuclease InsQ/TnpB family protein n=1 Tax=Nocardiopsis sp. EMB25 TaxID=2835867 RepID=UPI00228448CD|nr:transposase [Nocardiopsis sp. EMB25]MCY9783524.1 transposase [Nocardiopsis sp. EMB25]MCY9785340.1 transposase [Nocardiopsis sp. EMB25]
MLVGRRYVAYLTPEQEVQAQGFGDACRWVWNAALEQRREANRWWKRLGKAWTHPYPGFTAQARQLSGVRAEADWLAAAPSHVLQQTLKDLDTACRTHGTNAVRWRSKGRWHPSFRFPDPKQITVEKVNRRWGRVKLPKLGWVRFRRPRGLGGQVRNVTVSYRSGAWHVTFCVEDGRGEAQPNGRPDVGVDRGVVVAAATSDGRLHDRAFTTLKEEERLVRLQRARARRVKGSANWRRAKAAIARIHARRANRRADFNAKLAHHLTRRHGMVVLEELRVVDMTRSARGTVERPGTNVAQKRGLNRAILAKGWGDLARRCEYKAKVNGSSLVRVNPAFTSQGCNRCGEVDAKSRESQAVFACTSCGHTEHADVHAATNVLDRGRTTGP